MKKNIQTLSLPRIFFQGIVHADVPTGNNQDSRVLVDVPTATVNDQGMRNDNAFREWLMSLNPATNQLMSGWNYFGDNSFTFHKTRVTGVQGTDGVLKQSADDDPLVGAKVDLQGGVCVDVDPNSNFTSYLLGEKFTLGEDGSGSSLAASNPSMGCMRDVTTTRSLYRMGDGADSEEGAEGAIMQLVVRNTDLTFVDGASLILKDLAKAANGEAGIAITFVLYAFDLEILRPKQLAENFAQGNYVHNPAIGLMLGNVGVWPNGNPQSQPLGRYLNSTATRVGNGVKYDLGPAIAQVDARPGYVTLNMMNTVPEVAPTLEKVDLGELRLAVKDACGNIVPVSQEPIAYDRANYESTSGIVDVEFDKGVEGLLKTGQLLVTDAKQKPVLAEEDGLAVTDDWVVYLPFDGNQKTELQVFDKGTPARAGIEIAVHQYRLLALAPTGSGPISHHTHVVSRLVGRKSYPPQKQNPTLLGNVTTPATVTTNSSGVAKLTIEAISPGACMLRFVLDKSDPEFSDPSWDWTAGTSDFYSNVRVLPEDNLDHLEPTWENVYERVFRYYFLIYPAMSQKIPMNNKQRMSDAHPAISHRVQLDWNDTAYMPRTRDLSEGKKKFVLRWCEQQS